MFAMILFTQWRWTRIAIASFSVIAFLAPVSAWRLGASAGFAPSDAQAIMSGFTLVGPSIAVLSIVGALVFAALPWTVDAQAKHVYPLSLPIAWPRYVAMRFWAGALTLLLPAFALWLGALLALSMIELPGTLQAFPGLVALRFLIGLLLAYSMTFALQHIARRKSAAVLLILLLATPAAVLILHLLGLGDLVNKLGDALIQWPGPLSIYASEWKLIDV